MGSVLVAFVTIDGGDGGKVCVVRTADVGKALVALHGAPEPGLQVVARIEYAMRSAADVVAMEAFNRLGLGH